MAKEELVRSEAYEWPVVVRVYMDVTADSDAEARAVAIQRLHDVECERIETEVGDPVEADEVCVCGVYRSEHSLCGCPEGFTTPDQWEAEKRAIWEMDDDTFERRYG